MTSTGKADTAEGDLLIERLQYVADGKCWSEAEVRRNAGEAAKALAILRARLAEVAREREHDARADKILRDDLEAITRERDEARKALKNASKALDPEKRTYSWNGHTHEISRPDLSDIDVAGEIRMLMRTQLNHEAICMLGRDRIVHLHEVIENARAAINGAKP